jgi:hypothetical protein
MDAEENRIVEAAFIAALRSGADKLGLLQLAGVPLEIDRPDEPGLKLVEIELCDHLVIGTAAPGFGARELVYQPLPGAMTRQHTHLRLIYVSIEERRELTLAEALAAAPRAHPMHYHDHGVHWHVHHAK